MKVIKPNGTIVNVCKVKTYAERIISFNGDTLKYSKEAKDIDSANALVFILNQDNSFDSFGNNFILGNLTQDKLRDVLDDIVITDYVDLTKFDLQESPKTCNLFSQNYAIDNGVSKPYFSDYIENICCTVKEPVFPIRQSGITQREAYELAGVNPNGYSECVKEADEIEFGCIEDEEDYDYD